MDKLVKVEKQDTTLAELWRQPIKYYETLKTVTIIEAVNSDSPALAKLKKDSGEQVILAAIVKIVGQLVLFFAVGKSINDYQLAETAQLLLQEFYFLKLEDFKVFSNYMKSGRYGQAYDRVDGNTIMVALRQYCAERAEICEIAANKAHEVIKAGNGGEKYYCALNERYVRDCGDTYEWVDQLDFATKFSYAEAYGIKVNGNNNIKIYKCEALERALANPEKVKELDKYLADKKNKGDNAREKRNEVFKIKVLVAEINAMDISAQEKELKIRHLYKLD